MRPYASALDRLRNAGLRPTRQRLALAKLLFENGDRHITAEDLHSEARNAGVSVSLATVYNTLHQFTQTELLREVVVESGRAYFDTNTTQHSHFFFEKSGRLMDIPADAIEISQLPSAPDGAEISGIDVTVRIDA
ncbi:MAG: transcriptional repressor [Alphaproteobacteria bacterium]|nr:transcriptional repressor [Alphaproteobacteria bacterium]